MKKKNLSQSSQKERNNKDYNKNKSEYRNIREKVNKIKRFFFGFCKDKIYKRLARLRKEIRQK